MFVAFATQPLFSGLLVMAPFGEFPPPGLEAWLNAQWSYPSDLPKGWARDPWDPKSWMTQAVHDQSGSIPGAVVRLLWWFSYHFLCLMLFPKPSFKLCLQFYGLTDALFFRFSNLDESWFLCLQTKNSTMKKEYGWPRRHAEGTETGWMALKKAQFLQQEVLWWLLWLSTQYPPTVKLYKYSFIWSSEQACPLSTSIPTFTDGGRGFARESYQKQTTELASASTGI